jgi:hypothetical protein
MNNKRAQRVSQTGVQHFTVASKTDGFIFDQVIYDSWWSWYYLIMMYLCLFLCLVTFKPVSVELISVMLFTTFCNCVKSTFIEFVDHFAKAFRPLGCPHSFMYSIIHITLWFLHIKVLLFSTIILWLTIFINFKLRNVQFYISELKILFLRSLKSFT